MVYPAAPRNRVTVVRCSPWRPAAPPTWSPPAARWR